MYGRVRKFPPLHTGWRRMLLYEGDADDDDSYYYDRN